MHGNKTALLKLTTTCMSLSFSNHKQLMFTTFFSNEKHLHTDEATLYIKLFSTRKNDKSTALKYYGP